MIQLSDSDSSDGCSYVKQRKLNVMKKNNPFKDNILSALEKVGVPDTCEFTVYGKIDAPMITVSIKNVDNGIVYFPLFESDAGRVIKLIEQSVHGKATGTVDDRSVITSWQLHANGFEISNPSWDNFISEVLVPRIKKEMFINCSFTANLKELLLFKTGSLPAVHCDLEKKNTMIGTLLIQLPSRFKGGQLNVHYNKKKAAMDFGTDEINNTYSTFFCTFNSDCLLQDLPVLEGYRVCLIYNLMSNQDQLIPQKRALETQQLVSLFSNWNEPSKVVYALKHKYSESNLLFEHLKTTDQAVANILLDIAKTSHLNVFLGILNRKSFGRYDDFQQDYEFSVSDVDFDSDDDDSVESKIYTLSNLVAHDGSQILTTSSLTVLLHQEVIPENCFEHRELSRKSHEPKENTTSENCKYYRIAVIVILPKYYFMEILKRDGATSFDIDMIFLKEIKEQRGWENDERLRTMWLAWASEVLSLNNAKSLNMIRSIVALNNLELIKALFGRCVVLNESSIRVLEDMCEKYGWQILASEIATMFNKLSKEIAVQLLGQLVGIEELQKEKQKVCHDVLKIILNKFEDEITSHSTRYVPHLTLQAKLKKRKNNEDILLSICHLSQMISYNMLEFAKTQSVLLFVPVLLKLVSEQTKKISPHWLEIAQYYLQVMEDEARKPSIVPNWQQMYTTSCSCNDCLQLNGFLGSDIDSIRLKMGKQRRTQLQERMRGKENISYETDSGGNIGALVIKKTLKTGDSEEKMFSNIFLEKLRAVLL